LPGGTKPSIFQPSAGRGEKFKKKAKMEWDSRGGKDGNVGKNGGAGGNGGGINFLPKVTATEAGVPERAEK